MVHRIPTEMGVPFIEINMCTLTEFSFSHRSSAKKSTFSLYAYFVFNSSFVNYDNLFWASVYSKMYSWKSVVTLNKWTHLRVWNNNRLDTINIMVQIQKNKRKIYRFMESYLICRIPQLFLVFFYHCWQIWRWGPASTGASWYESILLLCSLTSPSSTWGATKSGHNLGEKSEISSFIRSATWPSSNSACTSTREVTARQI